MTDSEAMRDRVLSRRPAMRPWVAAVPFLLLLQALLAVACFADEEQVYVIASEPYPNTDFSPSPAILYRVEGGRLEKVRTITTVKQDTLFVDPYPDHGYVFVGSVGARPGAFLLDVLDLGSVGVELTLDLDGCWGCNASNRRSGCMGCRYATSHLLNRDGRLIYMIRPGTRNSEQLDCACQDLGVDVRTGEAITGLGTGDLQYAYQYGAPGGLVDGGEFGADIYGGGTRARARGTADVNGHDLGWELPLGVKLEAGRWGDSARLMIDNDNMRVLGPITVGEPDRHAAERLFYVFDKESGEWSRLKLLGSGVPMPALRHYVSSLDMSGTYFPMRAFRDWLATEEIYGYEPGALEMERLAEQRFGPFRSAAERFVLRQTAPSGRFRLHNAQTRLLIVHDTGEPNSEVLYVDEDDVAWYRVSDELRRAPIQDGRLGPPEVIVKSPELWAVHWLFLGRE